MQSVATFTPVRSATTAILIAAVKPKNLLLTIGAATAIAETGAGTGQQASALAIFGMIGTLGPGIPVAIYLLIARPSRAHPRRHARVDDAGNTTIIIVLCLIVRHETDRRRDQHVVELTPPRRDPDPRSSPTTRARAWRARRRGQR